MIVEKIIEQKKRGEGIHYWNQDWLSLTRIVFPSEISHLFGEVIHWFIRRHWRVYKQVVNEKEWEAVYDY